MVGEGTCKTNLRRMDSNENSLTVGLLALNPFNMDNELLAITSDHLSRLIAFVVTTDNLRISETEINNSENIFLKR